MHSSPTQITAEGLNPIIPDLPKLQCVSNGNQNCKERQNGENNLLDLL